MMAAPTREEPPCTRSLLGTVRQAIPAAQLVRLRTLDAGYVSNGPGAHSGGEYSIEVIVQK